MRAGTDDQSEARGPGLGTGARSIAGLDFRQFYAWRPAQNVARRRARWHGISAEIHCVGSREPYEARGRYPVPALTFCEHGRRKDGESRIEGSPTSTVRNVSVLPVRKSGLGRSRSCQLRPRQSFLSLRTPSSKVFLAVQGSICRRAQCLRTLRSSRLP